MPIPTRPLFKGKTLLYAEESMLAWIMSGGVIPVLLPRAASGITARDLLSSVDGLILQGGVDMSPFALRRRAGAARVGGGRRP